MYKCGNIEKYKCRNIEKQKCRNKEIKKFRKFYHYKSKTKEMWKYGYQKYFFL